jgi:16S rRNA (guanine966-N2)-methyltransferase
LPVVEVQGLRPTSERIRETLFNWLAPVIDGAHCLDLCAGTGALGFEALSRGAASSTFIEKSPAAVRALKDAVAILQAGDAVVRQANAVRYLAEQAPTRFDVVFIDPPFLADLQADLCRLLAERGWLADDALVYLEQSRDRPAPVLPDGWHTIRDKTAGEVRYRLLSVRDKPTTGPSRE